MENHGGVHKRIEYDGYGYHFLLNTHTAINVATQDQGEEPIGGSMARASQIDSQLVVYV